MAAFLALMWAMLAGVVFTVVLVVLYHLTDWRHWRHVLKVSRRHAYLTIRTYARRSHVQRKPVRSGIAWWVADRLEVRRWPASR